MSRTLSPQALVELLDHRGPMLLLDVRRAVDFDADPHLIAGAERRDPQAVQEWASQLLKDRAIVLYCVRGGSVSNSVLDRLLQEGLQARYLEGGIEAWKKYGGRTTA